MSNIKFSVAPESHNPFSNDAAINLTTPGYAEYWLVEQGFAVTPTSDETEEFWAKHLTQIRQIQSSTDVDVLERLDAELDATENCLGYWVEYFMQKYFFIKTHIDIKQGLASENEAERHFAIIQSDKVRKDWHQEVSSLSENDLQEELDHTADEHHALNAMLTELRQYRASDDSLSHQWIFDKSFLSRAHDLEFYTQSWERLCSAYKTEFRNSGKSADGHPRKEQLRARLNRLIAELTEIREIAEEHWHTITQIKNSKHSKKMGLDSLAEYLGTTLLLKYKSIDVEQLCALQEEFERSVSAMNTMLNEVFSLYRTFETVPA